MKHKKRTNSEKIYRRLSIGLTEKIYNELYNLANEYDESIANIIRLVIDKNLCEYLSSVRYIDKEQADDILKVCLEISDNCRNILNNVRRIGVNYNQELKLKIAKEKYEKIIRGSSDIESIEAMKEYDEKVKEIEQVYFDKNELDKMLSDFENTAEKMEKALCLIHP